MGKDKKKSKGKKANATVAEVRAEVIDQVFAKAKKTSKAAKKASKAWNEHDALEHKIKGAKSPDALPGETEVDYQWRKAHEKEKAERDPLAVGPGDAVPDPTLEPALAYVASVIEQLGPVDDEPDDEAKHPHLKHLDEVGRLDAIVNDKAQPKKARQNAQARLDHLRAEGEAAQAKRDKKVTVTGLKPGVVNQVEVMEVSDVKTGKLKTPKVTVNGVPQTVTVVDTEVGREFQVGAADTLSAPTQPEGEATIERDHLGRPKIQYRDAAGKVKSKAYTRVTTYIKCLEDTSLLEKWKLRTSLIGMVADAGEDNLIAATRLVTAHDKALRVITKREKKGELDLGQFGLMRADADKALRDGLNAIADKTLDLGGAHEKALKGTNLHALTAMLDEGKIAMDDPDGLENLVESGLATHSDIADLRAYDSKMRELGIRHVAVEQMVVIDELAVAGTLDRASLYRFPGTTRAIRCVADIKTGRVDYGAGTIGMQIKMYALGKSYDPSAADPSQREDLKLSKSKGLLIHLPQGQARCEVYEVDLDLATVGTKLAGEVRAWRNAGKRVVDLTKPLAVTE
jgi:hypothetical protein